MSLSRVSTMALPEVPYRGIEAFRFVDQEIFCARRAETLKVVRTVVIYRGVLLYGASGVGKSSLINAGLIPSILEEGFCPERIRLQPLRGQEMIVERIAVEEGARPSFLPSIFFSESDPESRVVLSTARLRDVVRGADGQLSPLLIFDQFEEFVTLFEEAPEPSDLPAARSLQQTILDLIVELLRDASVTVKLLFSFREDYLARLSRLFALVPDLTDHYVRLIPPSAAVLPQIIKGPFAKPELRQHFRKELPDEIERGLVEEIAARHAETINLSEIGIACLRLWQADEPIALLKRRGLQGLLEDYLAHSLAQLGKLSDPAIALLSRMVTERGTRNPISGDDLIERVRHEEKLPVSRLKDALLALESKTRLVHKESRNDSYVYEIVSEFLVPWIGQQKRKRAEAIRMRKLLRWCALTAVVFLVLGFFLTEALRQSAKADKFRARAEDMVSYILFDLRDQLLPKGNVKEVQAAAKKALDYLSGVKKTERSDRSERLRATALVTLGDISFAEDKPDDAESRYREALAISQALHRKDPTNGFWQMDLAVDLERMAKVLRTRDYDASRSNLLQAMSLYAQLMQRSAKHDPPKNIVGRYHANTAIVLASLADTYGVLSESLRYSNTAVSLLEKLAVAYPADVTQKDTLASAYRMLGEVLVDHGDLQAAIQPGQKAVALHERLARESHGNAKLEAELCRSRLSLAITEIGAGRLAQARARADSVASLLGSRNPLSPGLRHRLGEAQQIGGDALLAQGDTGAALARYSRCQAIYTGESPPSAIALSWVCFRIGSAHAKRGESALARQNWSKGIEIIAPQIKMKDALLLDSNDSNDLDTYVHLLLALDRLDEARPVCRKLRDREWNALGVQDICRSKGLLS